MLLLRRKRGESIVIGREGNIQVKILSDIRGVITLGIQPPPSVQVYRLEVIEERQKGYPTPS